MSKHLVTVGRKKKLPVNRKKAPKEPGSGRGRSVEGEPVTAYKHPQCRLIFFSKKLKCSDGSKNFIYPEIHSRPAVLCDYTLAH